MNDEWFKQALCRAHPTPDDFFAADTNQYEEPKTHFPENAVKIQRAKDCCAKCPVIQTCLEWSIHMDEPLGIYGAHTVLERKKLMKRAQWSLSTALELARIHQESLFEGAAS